jgi:hypothetical protein
VRFIQIPLSVNDGTSYTNGPVANRQLFVRGGARLVLSSSVRLWKTPDTRQGDFSTDVEKIVDIRWGERSAQA